MVKDNSHRQIMRAATLVMAAFAASRLLGLARQMVFSHYFGTTPEMDAYVAALRIPEMLFLVIAGGALGSAFIPTFTARLTQGDEAAAWRLASAIINLLLLILLPLTLLTILAAPWLVRAFVVPAFPPDLQQRTTQLMQVMLASTAIFGVSGIVMGALNAHQHFLLPAIAPIFYNLALIGGAVWGGQNPQLGTLGPAIAMVIGAGLHLLIQVPGLIRYGARYTPSLGLRDPDVLTIGRLMGPRVLGVAAVQLNFVVTNNLASHMGPGAIAALDYAWRLMLLPQGILAQAVGTAVFPTFSAQAARQETKALQQTLSKILCTLIALTLPATAGLIILGPSITTLIFERGAFTEASAQAVVWALGPFALGLMAHSLIEILARAFYALHDTWTPALAAGGAMLLNLILGLTLPPFFTRFQWPAHTGLAFANSLAALVEMALLLKLITQRLGRIHIAHVARQTLRAGVATAGMTGLVWVWLQLAPANVFVQSLGGVGVGACGYFALALWLNVQELRDIGRILLRK